MRYCFDLDGTICTQEQNYHDARPIASMVDHVRRLHAEGHSIVIFTARGTETGMDWRSITEAQLAAWGVPYDRLMFGKPAADFYVDDRAVPVRTLERKPAYICAEVGINHSGSLEAALKLIDAAVAAGANAVKFQKRSPSLCVPRDQWDIQRATPWGVMSYIDYKHRLELSPGDYYVIDAYCREKAIEWSASAWDVPSLDFLMAYNLPWLKVASASLTDDNLLHELAETGKPIILSTGMSTIEELRHATDILGDSLHTICHCNSTYPCPPEDLNLLCIETLRREFPGVAIGYSGHEVGLATTLAAVAMGASFIERHITLDRASWGTDQSASVEPHGFERLVRDIRSIESAMGDGVKRITEGELGPRARLRGVPA